MLVIVTILAVQSDYNSKLTYNQVYEFFVFIRESSCSDAPRFFFANIFKKILKSVARLKKMLYLCNNKIRQQLLKIKNYDTFKFPFNRKRD